MAAGHVIFGSRTFGARCVSHNVPSGLPAREVRTIWLTLENTGTRTWTPPACNISVLLDGVAFVPLELPHAVSRGDRVTLHGVFRVTDAIGSHELAVGVAGDGATPADLVFPLRLRVEVVAHPSTETGRLRDRVLITHARSWLPCDGMSWSSGGGVYPNFARAAHGCRITDVEGREFVDYIMGWGCALLGYSNERIAAAIADALGSGAILSLTHELMPQIADRLCEMFPSAEAATFGKNGSDACTAAVRLARAYTGRPVILCCGYHGWQDWYVEQRGLTASGVPERSDPLLFAFQPNNLAQVEQLLHDHRDRVAAVLLEPAGVLESYQGPSSDADPAFLHELIALAHRSGALVIFDELMTGFRYTGGSVQHAAGVRPDLTCLGKALSAGMPLSAVIGRREIFDRAIARISYEPTFKGEAYSFAAAREALTIYKEQDIPARISSIGYRLREGINRVCREHHIAAQVIGPPFRMLLALAEPDARRRALMRTLIHQELLRAGVLTTQNLLLPSAAHDDAALDATERAFDAALRRLKEAIDGDCFAALLEIPPLPA
jgi:glutamate-1-semialdehyde aminotransferase